MNVFILMYDLYFCTMAKLLGEQGIKEALSKVMEPDLGKDLISLDLVDDIHIEDNRVSINMRMSNPAMHARKRMQEACEFAIQRAFGKHIEVRVNVEGMGKEKDSNPEQRKMLHGVKHVIAVASGKGGVGKSTITSNLAAGLMKQGYKVGLVDADIYGPSAPTMFDVVNERPQMIEVEGQKMIGPVESYGVKIMSIGFFADVSQAVVWRGPMASKALNQMFSDVHWGDLDYLLIDLPPGTGDIHLSLVQGVPLDGAVIVSTPQEVALVDARKGVSMFQLEQINVPVVGVVENMSWFTPEELPENKYYIFGKEGAKNMAEQMKVPFLGQIPLVQSVRESGDVGRPAVLQENTATASHFDNLVRNFVEQVEHKLVEQE